MRISSTKIFLFLVNSIFITANSFDVETDEKLALKYLSDYGYLSRTADASKGELER